MINKFETTIEEDEGILVGDSSQKLTFNEQICVKVRLRDKQILQENYMLAHRILSLCELERDEAERVVEERKDQFVIAKEYLETYLFGMLESDHELYDKHISSWQDDHFFGVEQHDEL